MKLKGPVALCVMNEKTEWMCRTYDVRMCGEYFNTSDEEARSSAKLYYRCSNVSAESDMREGPCIIDVYCWSLEGVM